MELVGFLLPPLIDVINRKVGDSDIRFWVSVFVCAIVGLGINYVDTLFIFESVKAGFDSISASVLIVFGAAQLTYRGIYEGGRLQLAVRE